MNAVFFEVAKTVDQSEPFAVIRIDTSKKLGAGVEGVVVSTHRTQEDADNARMDAVTMVEAAKELERLSALWVQETRENERLRAFASDVQWEVVMGALDKWAKHGGSDLVALGVIGQGLLILDSLRRSALR